MKKISKSLSVSLSEELSKVFGSTYSVRFVPGYFEMYIISEDKMFSKGFFVVLSHWCNCHNCSFCVDFTDFKLSVFKF